MKRYSLKHEFSISDENCAKIKDCNVQIYVMENGVEKKQIIDLFHTITQGYQAFLEEESGEQNNNIKKGWFHGI